jgi:hypothetical protein
LHETQCGKTRSSKSRPEANELADHASAQHHFSRSTLQTVWRPGVILDAGKEEDMHTVKQEVVHTVKQEVVHTVKQDVVHTVIQE